MFFNFKQNSIYYSTIGNGPVMVLIHGFLESSTMWDKIIPALSKKNQIITLDLPGHGRSDTISEIHSMELMADVVKELLDHLQISSATVVGHSMGGYVALALIEKYEEKVDRLFLINSTSKEDDTERKKTRDRAISVLKKNPQAFISMAISNLFSEESGLLFANEIKDLKDEAYSFPIEGIIANINGMKLRKERSEILKNFTKPKYLVAGIDDPLIPILSSEKDAKETGATFIKIESSHMALIEKTSYIEDMLLFNR